MQKDLLEDEYKFSILIPTWNNLDYLKLCIESINKNSVYKHQILIHVNEGRDGTLAWIQQNEYEHTYSENNIGVCWALNGLRPLVKTNYILYMNDDMYVCPGWDAALWNEIQVLPDNKFFFSSTLIQPRPFFCKSVIAPANFGESVETFNEEELLSKYQLLPHLDWFGATWPPNVVHRDIWDLVGGYSVEFSPGMYSDPDFSAKLWMAGVRLFKGISASRVYHFEARSTGRVRKNDGSMQFLLKWGITSASFMRDILKRGERFDEDAIGKIDSLTLNKDIVRSRLKRALCLFKKSPHSKNIWEK
ncbi:glycosyltransferase family 2 protein [Bacteroides acidifaciens]|uniref:glycosyltransferase family 2 protein n=1 Tax=Bacteroides acidifaciens TaxID=85831 RepID=UPI00158A49F4|nr:glycosyltransferase family 2 protein [Bacteroides acidifaciens]